MISKWQMENPSIVLFHNKNIEFLNVKLLQICQVFLRVVKITYTNMKAEYISTRSQWLSSIEIYIVTSLCVVSVYALTYGRLYVLVQQLATHLVELEVTIYSRGLLGHMSG